jgi:hypothetical protein
VNKWRLWLGSGMGDVISQELASTTVALDGPEMRRARRLVQRGEPAEDVVVARYAVAYARERQRRFERSSFTFWVALAQRSVLRGSGSRSTSSAGPQTRGQPRRPRWEPSC